MEIATEVDVRTTSKVNLGTASKVYVGRVSEVDVGTAALGRPPGEARLSTVMH